MKKNLFSILLVVVMTLAMVACGTQETTNDVPVSTETIEATVESGENSEAVSETEQATEAPVDEVVENTESVSETESAESASEPETSTEENSEAVSESDSEAVVEPEFTVTEVTATKYATQSVNVRSGPSTDYDKIGGLTTNQEITVNGVCDQTGWFRFDLNGTVAFVSNRYVSDSKVEKPAASETPSNSGNSTAGTGSTASNSCPYTLWQPVDEGGKIWWYVTQPDPNWETSGHKETQAWMMDTICDRGVANSGGVPEGYYGYAANEWIFMGTYAEGNVYYQSFYYATIPQYLVN